MIELPDDLPLLREIREQDWELIEHLAELATRASGNVLMAGAIEAERARQVLEMGSDAILNLIQHLAVFRRSDLIEALEIADINDNLTAAILQHSAEQLLRIKPAAKWAPAALAEQWRRAQEQPAETMVWLRHQGARLQGASETERQQIRAAMATRVGLDPRQRLERLRPLMHTRQDVLLRLADPLHRDAMAWRGCSGSRAAVEQLLGAYTDAAEMLADARVAGSWAALADGLGVSTGAVVAAYRLLAAAAAPEQPEPEPPQVEQPPPERPRECTAADDRMLAWISRYVSEHNGTSPTGPEISEAMQMSQAQIAYRLRTLEIAGRLSWKRVGQSRSFRIPAAA
jgi:hypothetical protein